MIGRFLLGSGLGALVGTGLLALVSVVSPAPSPGAPTTPPAAPKDASPDATTGEAKDAATRATTAAEGAPPAAPGDAAGQPQAPDAGADTNAEAAVETNPETSAPSAAGAPADQAPQAVADAPAAPEAPGETKAASAPAATDGPVSAAGPGAPLTPVAEAAPPPAETPAAPPEVTAATAPEALAEAPATPGAGPTGLSAEDAAPAAVPDPLQPGVIAPETAPPVPDLPGPPPLTPEEEALLRQLAEGSPGTPDAAQTLPEPALPEPALPEPEAGADMPAAEAAQPAPGLIAPDAPLAGAEVPGVTLIETDPALPSASAAPATPDGVTVDRLPRIGSDEAAAEAPAEAAGAAAGTPLAQFARSFANPENKPAFAIVLIDDGSDGLDRAALAGLPFAVTIALDPTHPKAADHAAAYRAVGQEVVMLVSALPAGAQAADVEVAMAAMAQALPESVAVMDLPEPAFQSDRPLATMVVSVVGAQGRGLLTWDRGLNAADQVARREDVPAAVAFRDLDGQGEAAPVIRRYLDRAAFKAAQEGRVTVIGRARPETLAAILEWTIEGRAATVALAPLSAVLSVD